MTKIKLVKDIPTHWDFVQIDVDIENIIGNECATGHTMGFTYLFIERNTYCDLISCYGCYSAELDAPVFRVKVVRH